MPVAFGIVDVLIRAIQRASPSFVDTYWYAFLLLGILPSECPRIPFRTVSFGSTWERRRLELLSLPTACRPTPIATTRIHFGVLLDAESGIEMQMVDYL